MVLIASSLLAAVPISTAPPQAPVCDLARTALVDYAARTKFDGANAPLDTAGANSAIFAQCPQLLAALPAPFRAATPEELVRIKDITSRNPVTIYTLSIAQVSSDHRTATVSVGYYCNGLCGFGYFLHYRRTGAHWVQVKGGPVMTWAS